MPDIKDSFQSLVALALGEYKAKNALGGDDVPAVQVRVEVPFHLGIQPSHVE